MKIKNLVCRNETPNVGVLFMYGDIYMSSYYDEDITPKQVIEAISSLGDIDTLDIHLNSNGGDVFAGVAIKNYLEGLGIKINVYVDALAASIASVIAQAASKGCLFMYSNTMMMIHDPWTICMGNARELRENADRIDKISNSTILESYMKRAKISEDEVLEFMAQEKWFSAKEALENGFCDEIIDTNSTVDCYKSRIVNQFRNTPQNLVNAKKNENDLNQIIEDKILEIDLI